MALDAARLSSAIQAAATGSGKMTADGGALAAMADAIAKSVVAEITGNAEILVAPNAFTGIAGPPPAATAAVPAAPVTLTVK